MRKSPLFFLILMLTTSGILLAAADYGESSASLGQFTDEFTDLNYTSVRVDVVRNSTYNAMELNITASGLHRNETLTDYTIVDNNFKIDVFSDRIEFVDFRRVDEAYVYFDYGVDYWDDFQVEFTVVINDTEAGDGDNRWINFIFTLNNYVGFFNSRPPGHDSLFISVRDNGATDNSYKFSISGYENAVLIGEHIGKVRAVSNNELYLRVNRTDDDYYLWVYSDPTYSTLDESLSLLNMGLTEPLRYIYALQSLDILNDGNIWMSGYVKDLWLGNYTGGYASEGYFTTTDYLDEANGSILVLMTNTTIPEDTGITVEFSEDNATWTLNDWDPIFGGFESIDLRELNWSSSFYVRYNETTSDPEITPRLYQSRLITTEGPEGEPGNGEVTIIESDFPWVAIAIILSLISYLLLSRLK